MPLEPHRSEACRSCQPMHVLSFGEGRKVVFWCYLSRVCRARVPKGRVYMRVFLMGCAPGRVHMRYVHTHTYINIYVYEYTQTHTTRPSSLPHTLPPFSLSFPHARRLQLPRTRAHRGDFRQPERDCSTPNAGQVCARGHTHTHTYLNIYMRMRGPCAQTVHTPILTANACIQKVLVIMNILGAFEGASSSLVGGDSMNVFCNVVHTGCITYRGIARRVCVLL